MHLMHAAAPVNRGEFYAPPSGCRAKTDLAPKVVEVFANLVVADDWYSRGPCGIGHDLAKPRCKIDAGR